LIRQGLVKSAHDCSEGGLAVAMAECCFHPEKLFGAEITCSDSPAGRREKTSHRDVAKTLFNESQSRIIISVGPDDFQKTISTLRETNVPFEQLGRVTEGELCIRLNEETFRWPITDLYDDWWNAIRRAVESDTDRIPSL
jgi:phosphoribosylformylglycinamidine synthase